MLGIRNHLLNKAVKVEFVPFVKGSDSLLYLLATIFTKKKCLDQLETLIS